MHTARSNPLGTLGRVATTIVFALAMLMIAATLTPQPAQAWYRAAKDGRPGSFTTPTPMAIDSWDGLVWYMNWRTNKGPLVYRSAATRGAQNVVGIYTIQEWTPSFGWTRTTSQTTQVYRIPRGVNSVRLPALDRAPNTTRGYFRIVYTVVWMKPSTGATIGTSIKLPNRTTDHKCVTNRRLCEVGTNYIRTGRLATHGGGW